MSRSRTAVVAVALAALVTSIVAGASPASAADGGGVLWIHSTGTTFANPNSNVSAVVAAGGTATYTLQVVNEGPALAQFNLKIVDDGPGATYTLTSGSLIATPVATGPDGYFTMPIAPKKSETLTLKVKTPATATQNSDFFTEADLYDTAGVPLSYEIMETEIKAGTGVDAVDSYSNTLGVAAVLASASDSSYTTAPAIKGTSKATFTVKLQNDAAAATVVNAGLSDNVQCGAHFPMTAKVGATDITAALRAGTYSSPLLAHKKSVTVTVTVGAPSPVTPGCGWDVATFEVFSGGHASFAELTTNLAATLP